MLHILLLRALNEILVSAPWRRRSNYAEEYRSFMKGTAFVGVTWVRHCIYLSPVYNNVQYRSVYRVLSKASVILKVDKRGQKDLISNK